MNIDGKNRKKLKIFHEISQKFFGISRGIFYFFIFLFFYVFMFLCFYVFIFTKFLVMESLQNLAVAFLDAELLILAFAVANHQRAKYPNLKF